MPNWIPVVITQQGLALQAKVEAGATLTFTRMALGSGMPANLSTATALGSLKQNLAIASKGTKDNTSVIYATGTNAGVQTAYKASELGLFAQDPDLGEILYAITTDGTPDTVPASTSATVITQRIGMAIAISAASNVSVVLSTNGFITAADAENIANDVMNAHKTKTPLDHPDSSVTEPKLAPNSVSTRTIVPKAVTGEKLTDSGVIPGTYTKVTVDRTGRVTNGGDISVFQGATSGANGTAGLVPAPSKAEVGKVLGANGQWITPYSHPVSSVTPGTYRNVTVNNQGHVTGGNNPTLAIDEGGTGATSASQACGNLGALDITKDSAKFTAKNGLVVFSHSDETSGFLFYGGSNWDKGSLLRLQGNNANNGGTAGRFDLSASNGTNTFSLTGKPDGSLKWGGKEVIRIVESYYSETAWYRKYSDGWVEQGGFVSNILNEERTVTLQCPMANVFYFGQVSIRGLLAPGDYRQDAISINNTSTTTVTIVKRASSANMPITWEIKGQGA